MCFVRVMRPLHSTAYDRTGLTSRRSKELSSSEKGNALVFNANEAQIESAAKLSFLQNPTAAKVMKRILCKDEKRKDRGKK